MRILVVEDETKIAQALRKGLTQENYSVDLAHDGEIGYDMASSEEYDLIILDVLLPKMDGVEVCQRLRGNKVHTPILMLTALSQVRDKTKGLDAGADDYLPKPFAFEELLARVRALLRRPRNETGTILTYGEWTIDTTTKVVKHGEQVVSLSSREYSLLDYLMRYPTRVLSKEQITAHVWDYESEILPNTVEAYIAKLRVKGVPIVTMRGFGYKLGGRDV